MPLLSTNPENYNVIAMPVTHVVPAVDAPVANSAEPAQEATVEKKEGKKQLKHEDLLQMIAQFNAQLDNLCTFFDVKITDEDMKICPNANIDHLLSFETKVNYVCEFFEGKHMELTDKIIGSK